MISEETADTDTGGGPPSCSRGISQLHFPYLLLRFGHHSILPFSNPIIPRNINYLRDRQNNNVATSNSQGGGTLRQQQERWDENKNILEIIIGYFLPDWRRVASVETEGKCVLSDEEVDNLAVLQGDLNDYLTLQEAATGPVSPSKVARMQDLLGNDTDPLWEERCLRLLAPTYLYHCCLRDFKSYRAKLRAFLGTWNPAPEHCSENVLILEDQVTAHRLAMLNRSDAVRSKMGVVSGHHAWEIRGGGLVGSHFSVGVTTDKGPLSTTAGYVSLIGDDDQSWGWDIIWGNLSHDGKIMAKYPRRDLYEYTPGDTIRLTLNYDQGEMSFAVNETDFGIAFNNLPTDVPLYPAVGLVYGNLEVSLLYLGTPPPFKTKENYY